MSLSDRRKLGGDHLSNFCESSRTAMSPRAFTSAMISSTVPRVLASASSCWPASAAVLMWRGIGFSTQFAPAQSTTERAAVGWIAGRCSLVPAISAGLVRPTGLGAQSRGTRGFDPQESPPALRRTASPPYGCFYRPNTATFLREPEFPENREFFVI